MVANNMIGVCESLIYASKVGLDEKKISNFLIKVELLSGGAAGSAALKVLGPKILNRDFEPGFYVEHFVKDLGIVMNEIDRMGISLPGAAMAL